MEGPLLVWVLITLSPYGWMPAEAYVTREECLSMARVVMQNELQHHNSFFMEDPPKCVRYESTLVE
jgi:hypothetical protein